MKRRNLILSLLIVSAFCLIMVGCLSSNQPKSDKLQTTLKLNWIYTGSFAGDALAVKEFAPKYNLRLQTQPGGQGLDPIKLVGENEFGTASADEILAANDKGADLVIIGVVNDISPAVFVSKAEDNIKTPKDFEGKTVGILPFGSTGLVYKSLLKKADIDSSKITEKSVSPDLKVFIVSNSHQVQPAFIFDEPVSLDSQGIKYNLIEPKDYGVKFKGVCYFTKRSTVDKNPQLVQAFINTMADGWREAIKSPDKAIKALKEIDPNIDEGRELKVLERGIPYFKGPGDKALTSDSASWNEMISDLKDFGIIKNDVDLSKVLNFSFINSYYNSQK